MTYNVFGGTLNPTLLLPLSSTYVCVFTNFLTVTEINVLHDYFCIWSALCLQKMNAF